MSVADDRQGTGWMYLDDKAIDINIPDINRATAPSSNVTKTMHLHRTTSDIPGPCLREETLKENLNTIEPSELKPIKKLGEGAFAIVEQCKYTPASGGSGSRMVAVKKLKSQLGASTQHDLDSFMAEVKLMRKLEHKHIVEYIGMGSGDPSSPETRLQTLFLVSEFMEGGTLKRLVMHQMSCPHTCVYGLGDALRWCTQIATALAYLHGQTPAVIHRDLKLENILLKGTEVSTQQAKLADFGLVAFFQRRHHDSLNPSTSSILNMTHYASGSPPESASHSDMDRWTRTSKRYIAHMSNTHKHTNIRSGPLSKRLSGPPRSAPLPRLRGPACSPLPQPQRAVRQLSGRTGTYMYMAPEMFRNEEYTEKVDVFSFGVMMYELLHKYMMVFAVSMKGTEEEIEQYAERVSGGWRPPLNEHFPSEVLSIIESCWAQNPRQRSSMSDIARRLNQALRDEGVMDKLAERSSNCCTIS